MAKPTMFLLNDLEELGGKLREAAKIIESGAIPEMEPFNLESYESLVSQSRKLKRKIMERLK